MAAFSQQVFPGSAGKWKPNAPVLLLMAGLPGSGKSTLALAAGKQLGWPVLDKDTVKSSLLTIGVEEDLAARASYELLHDLAEDLLVVQGLSAILDTPSSYEEVIEASRRIAVKAGGVLRIVLCEAPREVRAERLQTRLQRPSHVMEIDEEAERVIERRFRRLPRDTIRLCTAGPAEQLADRLVSLIQDTTGPLV